MSEIRLSLAVQHHPSRPGALYRTIMALYPAKPEVIVDPEPGGPRNAWRSYRLALNKTPACVTHRVIVQDDTIPVPGFAAIAARALAAKPNDLVCFFVSTQLRLTATRIWRDAQAGKHWTASDPHQVVPTVALAWPAALIDDFLAWDKDQRYRSDFTADDERVLKFLQKRRQQYLITIPNLVEHPDDQPSVGRSRQARGQRTSCCPPPDGCDLNAIEW